MSYKNFVYQMRGLARKSNLSVHVRLDDSSRYTACFSDGSQITGNSKSKKLTVTWGSGHRAMFEAA